MAPSTEAQIKQRRRQLVADGVHDPFELLGQAQKNKKKIKKQVEINKKQN